MFISSKTLIELSLSLVNTTTTIHILNSRPISIFPTKIAKTKYVDIYTCKCTNVKCLIHIFIKKLKKIFHLPFPEQYICKYKLWLYPKQMTISKLVIAL